MENITAEHGTALKRTRGRRRCRDWARQQWAMQLTPRQPSELTAVRQCSVTIPPYY